MKTKLTPTVRLLLTILMCLPVCGSRLSAQQPYAMYDKATSTLTFKYGIKPTGVYSLNEGDYTPDWYKSDNDGANTNTIEKVVFDASFAKARPTSCYKWFYGCTDLTTIEGIEYLNTENVTNMSYMFGYCSYLAPLDVSNFDTKNVTDMSYMFYGCSELTTLNVSNFDTKNVTDMSGMFGGCYGLTTLDVSKFDTKNVTNMSQIFDFCRALTTLDVSKFDTKNVTNMSRMFLGCEALKTLDVSKFDTHNVTNMGDMFYGCSALKTLDLSSFYTKNVTDMSWMFYYCSVLTTIYTSYKFVTTACEEDENMFKYCTNLVGAVPYDENKVDDRMANYTTGYFTYKAPTEPYAVFDESTNTLTFKLDNNQPTGVAFELNEGKNLPDWYKPDWHNVNTNIIEKVVFDASFANARPTSCYKWFYGCKDLTTIKGIQYLNTENVTTMGDMFYGCSALTTLDVSKFDTKNVTNMGYMFYDCKALTTLDVSKFDTKNVTNMGGMFRDCSTLKTLDLSNFDTKNMHSMSSMFEDCSALKTLDLSNFDTQNVRYMDRMFKNCSALTTLDLSNFDTQNVTDMSSMFYGCEALTTIYASEKYVTTACTSDDDMFWGCTNLVGAVPYDQFKVGKKKANYTTGYFTYKAPTGIDTPTVSDDTTAEYYDLQGRRLNAPQKGVNIVKRGKKTTKMLVK